MSSSAPTITKAYSVRGAGVPGNVLPAPLTRPRWFGATQMIFPGDGISGA